MYKLSPIFLALAVAMFIIGLHQVFTTDQIQANYAFFMFAVGFLFLAGYVRKFGKKPEPKEKPPKSAKNKQEPQYSRQQRRLQQKQGKKKP